jgi:L-amino acid N-acyltransferase
MIAGTSVKSSEKFHEKFGFTKIGTLKEVGFKFNKWHDVSYLQLFLD